MSKRNPNQKKCPGCRGFVKMDGEICTRCGVALTPGGDSGRITSTKEGTKSTSKEKDETRQNPETREPEAASTREPVTPTSGKRSFFRSNRGEWI
tara:strand:+ start:6323 stop:6607 length:285 start_codon:yes stop_codon:yes gene_type:complete